MGFGVDTWIRPGSRRAVVRCNPDGGSNIVGEDTVTDYSKPSPAAGEQGQPRASNGTVVDTGNGATESANDGAADRSDGLEEESSEKDSPVEVLRELLRAAEGALENARVRSAELEEDAQRVAEQAIAFSDTAAETEELANTALAAVEVVLAEESTAQESLEKAEISFSLAEDDAMQAELTLRRLLIEQGDIEVLGGRTVEEFVAELKEKSSSAAREQLRAERRDDGTGNGSVSEGAKETQLDSEVAEQDERKRALSAAHVAFEGKAADLGRAVQDLDTVRSTLQELGERKVALQAKAAELAEKAHDAREKSLKADELVTQAMALAEKGVAREVEASHRVNDAQIALQRAEKLATDVEQAAAAKAAAEKAEMLALEVAEAAAALAAAAKTEDIGDEEGIKRAVQLMQEAKDELPSVSAPQEADGAAELQPAPAGDLRAQVTEELQRQAQILHAAKKVDAESEVHVAAKGEEEKLATAKKPDVAKEKEMDKIIPGKSSTKKSSRFYPASYFSSEDGPEFQPKSDVRQLWASVKTNLPKVLLIAVVLLGSAYALNAYMARKALLQAPDMGPTVRPLLAEIKKLPARAKALIDRLPRNAPHEEETQLYDVLWLLLASVVFVPLFQKLPGGSPVLGYLTAGALIGPFALSIIQHVHGTKALAEFGVVFLMFNIGLELSLDRLRSMRKYVFGLGSAQTLVTAGMVGFLVHAFAGIPGPAAIVIGNGLALSSTAVVLQVLQERGESTSRHGRATFSVLLFQDLAVVVLLILIPLISPNSSKGGVGFSAIAEALGIAAVKAVVAITGIIAGGRLLLRPVYKRMAENHNAEIFAANTLLVVLGTSVLTARAGLSMALGAFLAGLLLAETEFALQVESDINPYRGLLLGLFFMTVGMSIDPRLLVARFPMIVAAIGALILGKTLLVTAVGRFFGLSTVAAIRAGLLLAPGGEFAFVAFGEAVNQGIMSQQLSSLLFLVVGISMAITPWLAAGGQLIASRFEQQDVRSLQPVEAETDDLHGHIIICGFGRIGQIIAQLLSERLIPFVALDVRTERVSAGRALDLPVYFGDAGSREVLHKVGADRAAAAVITLDTPGANYRTVWALSKNFPNIKTFVRAHDIDHGINLEKAGATAVVPETLEPSLQLAAAVLAQARMPASDIAATIDEFRTRHLSELAELSTSSGTSLGYGFSKILTGAKAAAAVPGGPLGQPGSGPGRPEDGGVFAGSVAAVP